MNKQKQRKITSNFLDIFTMKKLRLIVLICLVLSFFCEFFADIINIHGFSDDYLMIFLQSHKDFFVNILLGCLCSAIISYAILCIPQKLIETEKKEMIEKYYGDILNGCLVLNSTLSSSLYAKMSSRIVDFENVISLENTQLKDYIDKFLYYSEDLKIDNTKYDEMMKLCKKQLLPIVTEINIFFDSLKEYENIDMHLTEKNIKEIQFLLYDNLNSKYNFQNIIKDIIHIIDEQNLPIKLLDDMLNKLLKKSSEDQDIHIKRDYMYKIYLIIEKSLDEHQLSILKEEKMQLIKYLDEHMDTLEYGVIINIDGEKMYNVNGKIMKPKEYREYCIDIKLKELGLVKIDI